MTAIRIGLLSMAALGAACGGGGDDDGDDDPGDPVLVPGGGVSGGPIDGAVNVFVLDATSGAPLAGATVQVGDGPGATTDADGLAVIADGAITGPQAVTATAPGRVAATWIGVAGADVTIPLEPTAVPTAMVSGTIAGWDSLPAPGTLDEYTLGVIVTTLTDDLGARENTLTQATNGSGAPVNTCLRTAIENQCAWQLASRTGRQRQVAVIVRGDTQGTTDLGDDTYTLLGYAAGPSHTLTAGQQVTGQALALVPNTAYAPITVGFAATPPGLGEAIALPMLDLGEDGRIPFPLPTVTPGNPTVVVIGSGGELTGTHDVVGVASPAGAAAAPYSTVFTRGVATGATAQLAAWLPPPSQLAANGRTFTFADVGPDAIRYAAFERGGTRVWNLTILDRSTSFTLPAVSPDPLGTGTIELEVIAADVGAYSAADFAVEDFIAGLARAAGATTTFTR